MRRREYTPILKKPEFETYHRTYDRLRLDSYILNGGSKRLGVHTKLWDKQNIESEIIWLEGNKHGMVFNRDSGEETIALIPAAKEQLKELEIKFRTYQQRKVNEGFNRPAEMPNQMLKEKLKLEATLDVYQEELAELKKRLKKFTEAEDGEHKEMVLANGPNGAGSLHDGILVEIDGQKVTLNEDNVLTIDEPSSPYNKMFVANYRQSIVLPWKTATEKLRNEKASLSRKLISMGIYEDKFKTEWANKREEIIESNGWEDLFALEFNGRKIPKGLEQLKQKKKLEHS